MNPLNHLSTTTILRPPGVALTVSLFAVLFAILMSGCSEESKGKEKVRTPEMQAVKAELKEVDSEIEALEAKLGLAADSGKPEIQADIDSKKERRRELKQEWKKMKAEVAGEPKDE